MKILAYDPYVKEAPPEMEVTWLGSLLEVLQQADVVTLHLPSTGRDCRPDRREGAGRDEAFGPAD